MNQVSRMEYLLFQLKNHTYFDWISEVFIQPNIVTSSKLLPWVLIVSNISQVSYTNSMSGNVNRLPTNIPRFTCIKIYDLFPLKLSKALSDQILCFLILSYQS